MRGERADDASERNWPHHSQPPRPSSSIFTYNSRAALAAAFADLTDAATASGMPPLPEYAEKGDLLEAAATHAATIRGVLAALAAAVPAASLEAAGLAGELRELVGGGSGGGSAGATAATVTAPPPPPRPARRGGT